MKTFIITQSSGFILTISNVGVVMCDELHTLTFKNLSDEMMTVMVDNEVCGGTVVGKLCVIRVDTRTILNIDVR